MLTTLRAELAGELAADMPTPLALEQWGRVAASVETVMPGAMMLVRCSPHAPLRSAADLRRAAHWLLRLHLHTLRREGDSRCRIIEWIDQPFARYSERFGNLEQMMLDDAVRRAYELDRNHPLPSVARHSDFTPWNLLLTDQSLSVIDWEGAGTGLPFTDLVHLCTHWHELMGQAAVAPDSRRYRRAFVDGGSVYRTDRIVWQSYRHYLTRMGIDERWIPILTVATWVELALRRDQQLSDGRQRNDRPRETNSAVRYLEMLSDGHAGGIGWNR